MSLKILQLTRLPMTQWLFLMPLFRELRARGHQVEGACSTGRELPDIRAADFTVHEFPLGRSMNPLNLLRAMSALKALMRAGKYDVVVTHTPLVSGLGRLAAWAAGVPSVIYFVHGLPAVPRQNPLMWASLMAAEWGLSFFHHALIVINAYDARWVRRLRLVRPADMLFQVNGVGVLPERWDDLTDDARARKRAALGIPPDAPIVLMTARTDRRKGVLEYIRAAARVIHAGRAGQTVFLHAGNGPLDGKMACMIRELGVTNRVRLLGWRQDMVELVGLCDLFVLPSYYTEGLPISLCEAMAAGKAVISTRHRGCEDAVAEGETGLLVPPRDVPGLADAIARLLGDAALRSRLGAAGHRRARESFDARQIAVQTADIIEQVAARCGCDRPIP